MNIKRHIESKQHYIPPIKRPYITPQMIVEDIEEDCIICTSVGGKDDGMGDDPDDPNTPKEPVNPNDPYDPFTNPAKSSLFNDDFSDIDL